MFHRWTDSARPVKPKGMEDEDTLDRFQIHNVHGLVEYEDGHMERVWPNTIQFADGGGFDAYDWETMEAIRDDREPIPLPGFLTKDLHLAGDPVPANKDNAKTCVTCRHGFSDLATCEKFDYNCKRCAAAGALDCPCQTCVDKDKWEAEE
jgi:hypothetical protein